MLTLPEPLPVAQAKAGDSDSWDQLFKRYQLPLYVYVFELVGHEQASLDIVQETFISAARHIATLHEESRFGSWLFGIAHQKCLQQWRRKKRDEMLFEESIEAPFDYAEAPFDALIREEQEAELMELLHQLPLPQRSVLLLHFLENFSLEDIALITKAQLGTVKSRIHYAKRALRKLLSNQP